MKYTIKVDNQTYNVAISDLHSRPIVVTVGDEQFEVWPEAATSSTTSPDDVSLSRQTLPSLPSSPTDATPMPPGERQKIVRAPIPGMVSDILVKPGDSVTVGQPLCVLDAMKMNNTIRANRTGVIARVTITVGQHVKHSDTLIEFAD
jgi:glutaconyl-CoA/methylmalonyl-CoA decarboxylase subunit gamma